jgi:hypothetical protein
LRQVFPGKRQELSDAFYNAETDPDLSPNRAADPI